MVVLRITVNPIETLHEFRIYLFCDKEYEGKLPNYLILPPGDTQSTSIVYIKGMLGGGGGEEKGTMMTLEHTDELQEIWYPC